MRSDAARVSRARFEVIRIGSLVAAITLTTPLHAQIDVSGYTLGMGSMSGTSAWTPNGSTLLGRGRLMLLSSAGPLTADVAYEHVLTRNSSGQTLGLTAPGVGGTGDWLGTDWEVWSTDQSDWRHRLDRLSLGFSRGPVEVTVGRQAISWANTLFLTPADPFVPFDPSDPFRVYRAGVDAARVRVFPGPFTELEVVIRPTETSFGTTTTALVRAQTSTAGWALGAWGGALHDEPAGAVFATGGIGSTAVRTEVAVREDPAGGATVRAALGVDRYFTPGGKDLYWIGEVQFDGYGARKASHLLEVTASKPFMRGDMQTLGEWTMATQLSYQIHPLVGLDGLIIINAGDGSVLLAPGLSWSATGSASIRLGGFTGRGVEGVPPTDLGSEYGAIPPIGYVSVTWFF